ncbi:helicase associated domain-containing protein [Pelagophyceae sp. CCMP2097]|nr:helicase associated domain-containing protein [Pelagophyceae sp. CCMP2097]
MAHGYTCQDGTKLGRWAGKQREMKRLGRITNVRVAKLEAAGFPWKVQQRDANWDATFETMEEFHKVNTQNLVPQMNCAPPGTKLGFWMDSQRKAYLSGDMLPARVAKLESIGIIWKANASWDEMLETLKAFQQENGHCLVPYSFRAPDGTRLGHWVREQRRAYRACELTAEQLGMLDTANFFPEHDTTGP